MSTATPGTISAADSNATTPPTTASMTTATTATPTTATMTTATMTTAPKTTATPVTTASVTTASMTTAPKTTATPVTTASVTTASMTTAAPTPTPATTMTSRRSPESTGKSYFITGATSGIGRTAALHLAQLGHHVIAAGRREAALASLAAEAIAAGLHLDVVRIDVTDATSIAAAVAEANRLTDGRGVDGLVNNAGYGYAGPTIETSDAEMRRQFDTNVFGLMATTRAFLPQLRARRGRILNVSSIGGRVTFPLFGVYNASKYAVESLSDALRYELAPLGVAVVLIEPGPIRSEFSEVSLASTQQGADPSSPYAPLIARAGAIKEMADKRSAPPVVVARAIERALTDRRPRARYVAPWSMNLLLVVLGILPVRARDLLMRRMVGLTPAGLRLEPVRA